MFSRLSQDVLGMFSVFSQDGLGMFSGCSPQHVLLISLGCSAGFCGSGGSGRSGGSCC